MNSSVLARASTLGVVVALGLTASCDVIAPSCGPDFRRTWTSGVVKGTGGRELGRVVLRLFEVPAVDGARTSFTALFEEIDNTAHGPLHGHVTDARLVSAQDTLFVFELLPPPTFGFASVELGDLPADDMNRLRPAVLANKVSAVLRTDLPEMQSLVVPLLLVRDEWLKNHCDSP